MIDFTLILEMLTAAAAAFIAYRQHTQIKTSTLLTNFNSNSPLLPVISEGSVSTTTIAPEKQVLKIPLNIKQELNDAASAGVPYDFTKYGKGAILDLETGDITFK